MAQRFGDSADDDAAAVGLPVVGKISLLLTAYGYPMLRLIVALFVIWSAGGVSS